MVKILAQPINIAIIQQYMLTTVHSDEEAKAVYEKLEELIKEVEGTYDLVIMEDWNAVVWEGKEGKWIRAFDSERWIALAEFYKPQTSRDKYTLQPGRRGDTTQAPGDTARY